MIGEHPTPAQLSDCESEDDIRALSKAFSLRNWHYVDIAVQERVTEIVTRWPLLAELASKADKVL
ncbi:cellulose biosynthesis protein BcsR [Erwinia mallotivora]|uniref:cellulose biosynthesis protein BcsR n=1 Tax=Erwinia mallotivora TaxID=69222 RepID=UPI0035ECEAE7